MKLCTIHSFKRFFFRHNFIDLNFLCKAKSKFACFSDRIVAFLSNTFNLVVA